MKLSGTSLAGGTKSLERVENDYYATNPEATRKLLETVTFSGNFLEPCCGEGHISKEILKHYPNNEITSSDLIYRGFGNGNINFLKEYFTKYDNIITNPPYKFAKEFIEKSLEITTDKVAMFLKIQFLEGQSRKEWLKQSPLRYVYVFSKRQNPLRNGESINPETGKGWSSTMCFAWFIWEHGYKGEPTIRWI